METEFTPLWSLIGGGMIGSSAVLLMWSSGRIAGVSGIISGLISGASVGHSGQDLLWRLLFLMGILIAPMLYVAATSKPYLLQMTSNSWLMIAGGFLVGFGAVIGSGCTSGHGVCGIARLSKRSFVAVMVFIATAMLTVFLSRHLIGSY